MHSENLNFIKRETLAQVFSCESCEIFEKVVFYRTPPVVACESLFLHNLAYPSKPLRVVATPSNTSVLLKWIDGWSLGGLPFRFYAIYCVTVDKFGTCPQQNRIIDYTNYNATFSTLLPYTEYKFMVCAHNNVSFSNKYEGSNCETLNVRTKEGCK